MDLTPTNQSVEETITRETERLNVEDSLIAVESMTLERILQDNKKVSLKQSVNERRQQFQQRSQSFCQTHEAMTVKIVTEQTSNKQATIEIAPGVTANLRGATETWACIRNDFFLPTTCFACELEMCCILDASFVLCPHCKVISPLEGNEAPNGGVGLGFTFDDLQQWQSEILSAGNPSRLEI